MNTRFLLRVLIALVLATFFLAPIFLTNDVAAQEPQPILPGRQYGAAPRVSPADARKELAARTIPASPRAPRMLATSETEATPEIVALARGLKNDPKLIFDFVHNYIEYVPTYGSMNGATATLLARRGNDWDQASLFIALMRQAGFTANYALGDVTYSVSRLANWVGAANDINVTGNVFANGGVPVVGINGNLQITRVWAQAVVSGTTYTFDPAMKDYQTIAGIANLATALGYNQATFLANAQVGATVTGDYVQALNETNARANLGSYSANLVAYIRTNLPTANLAQVIGGRAIITSELTSYATALPYAISSANVQTFATIGDAYRHTLRVQHAGFDFTFKTYEIASKRMTIWYDGGSNAPVLRVDGMPIVTGTATISGTRYAMTVTIDHPYAGSGGTFADQSATVNPKSGAQYALMHDFNGASAELLAKRNAILGQSRAQGLAEDSESVRGESLSLMGQMWFYEDALNGKILGRAGKVVPILHHGAGLVGQEKGYFFDIPLGFVSDASSDGVSSGRTTFRARTMMSSAFEHGVLEQLQGSANQAVSTIKMLRQSNANGASNKTFLATNSNWTTGANVRSQLIDYTAGQLANLDAYIAANYRLVLPEDGAITVNTWTGNGFIAYFQSGGAMGMGMIINCGLAGGYVTTPSIVDSTNVWKNIWIAPPDQQTQVYTPKSGEPVDMLTGAYTLTPRS